MTHIRLGICFKDKNMCIKIETEYYRTGRPTKHDSPRIVPNVLHNNKLGCLRLKGILKNIIWLCYYDKIDFAVKFICGKVKKLQKVQHLIQHMEEDISNCSSTVMSRGTPCTREICIINEIVSMYPI